MPYYIKKYKCPADLVIPYISYDPTTDTLNVDETKFKHKRTFRKRHTMYEHTLYNQTLILVRYHSGKRIIITEKDSLAWIPDTLYGIVMVTPENAMLQPDEPVRDWEEIILAGEDFCLRIKET